ncbi:unnamed protein product [Mesocestoides corti]|uniref:DRBM domain-containing protein n=1 Tax=Mesocestoides corti TaxID=53468 RepID=A0A0R3U9Q2_MESCO|nr:unnamed protein product [Mesocestoides corti]
MCSVSSQTPISILQEISVKKCITVSYELVANEGQAHEPIYVYQCKAGKVAAIGKGASKKKAKHLASYYVLLKLLGDNPSTQNERILLQTLHASAASLLGVEYCDSTTVDRGDGADGNVASMPRAPVNFVSKVQEHCDKNMWPPPTYEFSECPPSLYGGKYQCKVRLWRWEYIGFGGSKKEAKRKAAAELLKEIVEQGLTIPPDALEALEEANLPLVEKQDLNTLRNKQSSDEKASMMARKICSGVFTNHGKLKQIAIDNLCSPSLDVYATLERILEEKKLTVFYSYTNMTESGNIYCQAQLSTVPPQVTCSRPCGSVEEARRDAAYRCLVYLEAMTRPTPTLLEDAWFRRPD